MNATMKISHTKTILASFADFCLILKKERLDIEVLDEAKCKERGFVYVFVIEGKIFKVGESITNIKDRIQSYNCGKKAYRENGTCSTTNYFVLQSFLAIGQEMLVYAFFPQKPQYEVFGQKFSDNYPPTKKAENLIIEDFIKTHGKKPIGCTKINFCVKNMPKNKSFIRESCESFSLPITLTP